MERTVTSARRWFAAGAGAITLLAYLLAFGNQWLDSWWTGRINAVPQAAGRVLTTLAAPRWRYSPLGGGWRGGALDVWVGQVAAGLGMVILVFLLVRWALRGVTVEGSGATVFLTTWALTALSGGIALAGGAALANRRIPGGGSLVADAAVTELPTGLFFGAMVGLLVGLVTAVFFIAGRREVPQAVEREYPDDFFGGDSAADDDATHISALTQPVLPTTPRGNFSSPRDDTTLPSSYPEDTGLPPA